MFVCFGFSTFFPFFGYNFLNITPSLLCIETKKKKVSWFTYTEK